MAYTRTEPFNWDKVFKSLERVFDLKDSFVDNAAGRVVRHSIFMKIKDLYERQMEVDLDVESGKDGSLRIKQYEERLFLPENFYKGSEYDLNIFRWNKEVNDHIDKMSFGYIECFPHQLGIKKKFRDENGLVKEYKKNENGEKIFEYRFPKLAILPVVPIRYRSNEIVSFYKEILTSNRGILFYINQGALRDDGFSPFSSNYSFYHTDELVINFKNAVYGLCEQDNFINFLDDFEALLEKN